MKTPYRQRTSPRADARTPVPPFNNISRIIHPTSSYQLNWSDPVEISRHLDLLSDHQQAILEATATQRRFYPQRFARPDQNYLSDATLLTMANYSRQGRICFCSRGGRSCGVWASCPYCRYICLRRMYERFHILVDGDLSKIWFTTLSSARPLVCQGDHPKGDVVAMWDAFYYGIVRSVERGLIRGAVSVEEFCPLSLFPLPEARVHVHVLVFADNLTDGIMDEVVDEVEGYTGQVRCPRKSLASCKDEVVDRKGRWVRPFELRLPCEISRCTTPMRSPSDLRNRLAYIQKQTE